MSAYYLSIRRTDGSEFQMRPGGPEERELVEEVVTETVRRGVGIFKTEAQVTQALRDAFNEVLLRAKRDVVPPRPTLVEQLK